MDEQTTFESIEKADPEKPCGYRKPGGKCGRHRRGGMICMGGRYRFDKNSLCNSDSMCPDTFNTCTKIHGYAHSTDAFEHGRKLATEMSNENIEYCISSQVLSEYIGIQEEADEEYDEMEDWE